MGDLSIRLVQGGSDFNDNCRCSDLFEKNGVGAVPREANVSKCCFVHVKCWVICLNLI